MRTDDAGTGQLQQTAAERRKARWSGAEGRRTEPAGPRPGPYRGSVHERPGFRQHGGLSVFALFRPPDRLNKPAMPYTVFLYRCF